MRVWGRLCRLAALAAAAGCAASSGRDAVAPSDAAAGDAAPHPATAPDVPSPDVTPGPVLVPVVVRAAGEKTFHHLECAVNAAGDGVAVWREMDGDGKSEVWASRLDRQGWQPAQRLDAGPPREVDLTATTIDGQGRALAVWNELGGMEAGVVAARFVPGTGWAPATRISSGWILSLAGSAAGDAAAFGALEGTPSTLLRFSPDAGWQDAALSLDRPGSFFADPVGRGVLVWNEAAAAAAALLARDYQPAGSWGAPLRVQEPRPFDHPFPIVNGALAADGTGLLLWNRGGERQGDLWAAARAAPDQWEPPHRLNEADPALWTTTVAAGEGGAGLVVWETGEAPRTKVWAALHAGDRWQPSAQLGEGSDFVGGALGPSGRAVVAWSTPAGVFGRRATAAGWGPTAALVDSRAGVADICAGVDRADRGWIVWIGASPQVVNAAAM